MNYPVIHKQALGNGLIYGPPAQETRQASVEDLGIGRAMKDLEESRDFVGRVLSEKAALAGILGEEKASLAVMQAMDGLRRAEDRFKALGGRL